MTKEQNHKSQNTQPQELYVQIKDEVADEIIKHGLSKTESKLFFYLLKLDRFGDKPAKVKVAEILLATGIGKTAYHAAMTKFESIGWFDFKHSEVEITNFCTPGKKSAKPNFQSEIPNSQFGNADKKFGKTNSFSAKANSEFGISENESPEPAPSKGSKTPQTLQTYSDLQDSLTLKTRESFEKFCFRKIEESSFKIASPQSWLNKHYLEYWEEFSRKHPEAAGVEKSSATAEVDEFMTAEHLRQMYGADWKAAAAHFGIEYQE